MRHEFNGLRENLQETGLHQKGFTADFAFNKYWKSNLWIWKMKINHQQAAFLRSIKKQNYPSQLAKIKSQPFLILTVGRRENWKTCKQIVYTLNIFPGKPSHWTCDLCFFPEFQSKFRRLNPQLSWSIWNNLPRSAEIPSCHTIVLPSLSCDPAANAPNDHGAGLPDALRWWGTPTPTMPNQAPNTTELNEMMETLAEYVSNLFKLKHYGFLRCGETGFDHYFKPTKTDDRHDNGDSSGINYMVAWWCLLVSNSKWFITGFISYISWFNNQ